MSKQMNKQMNKQMSNIFMKQAPVLFTFLLLFSCKTSGDLRAEKEGGAVADRGEIRTVPRRSQEPTAAPTQARPAVAPTMNEELAREIEILKGRLQEKDYLYQQEKAQLEARIQSQEQEKMRMMEEIQILKGNAPVLAAQSGDLLWETIRSDLNERKYAQAVTTLKEFLENFPSDSRVEEALILKGQCEYANEDFKSAMVSFSNYLDKYPKGESRAMAWLGQGVSLIRMKQKKDAVLFLEQCVSLYPKSKEAKLARRMLKTPQYVPPTIFL